MSTGGPHRDGPDEDRLFEDPSGFVAFARGLPADRPATARAAFLVSPLGLCVAADSASDNAYMELACRIDADRALRQHAELQQALSALLPTVCFPGRTETPDAVFPNNVFATANIEGEAAGRFIIGRMRHAVRAREAERPDIQRFFSDLLGYRTIDLRGEAGITELTGTLVIDRARGLGFAGLGSRCDLAGARVMHRAFGLRATLAFELAPGEYHTNVVMSALAGRTLALAPDGLADPAVARALIDLYGDGALLLDADELRGFAGNCIALDAGRLWMSATGADRLRSATRSRLALMGWQLRPMALDEIEKAGGSLRCCVAEIF